MKRTKTTMTIPLFTLHMQWLLNRLDTLIARLVLLMIHGYTHILRPLLPPTCRHVPSCSAYARQVLANRGFFKGIGWILRRLLRCHPFHPGGWDPPPE